MAGGAFSSDEDVISGINVTPLVDVVLVLLVIFLLTAPVIYQSSIQVQLPRAATGEKSPTTPLSFILTREGQVIWGKDPVDWDSLKPRLEQLVRATPDPSTLTATISADEATPHGSVIKLMDILRQSGLSRFALNVETPSRS